MKPEDPVPTTVTRAYARVAIVALALAWPQPQTISDLTFDL
jgi:hypothetical protein